MLRYLRAHWLAAVAVLSLAGLVIAVDPRQLVAAASRVRLLPLLLMGAVTVGSYACRGLAWSVALRRAGVRTDLVTILRVEFAGQVVTLMPAADLARVTMLRRGSRSARKISGTEVAATIVLQEFAFMTLLVLAALPAAISAPDAAPIVAATLLGLGLIIATLVSERAYGLAVHVVESVRPLRRWDRQFQTLQPAFKELLEWRTVGGVLLLESGAVALAVLLFFMTLGAVGATQVTLPSAAFALAVGHVFSGLSLVPLGLGIFEATVPVVMIASGVHPGEAAAAGPLFRGFNDVFMAGLGGLLVVTRRGRAPWRRR